MENCNCKSYNKPEWGGHDAEVILKAPNWSEKDTICVDKCMVTVIKKLWENNIVTLGCCCSHNQDWPSIIVADKKDAEKIPAILSELKEKRLFFIEYWQLQHEVVSSHS